MKKLLIIIINILILVPLYSIAAQDGTKTYTVSRSDVNRIVCPGAVSEVIFSEEKGITSKVVGNEAFIKFPVTITVDQETMSKSVSYSTQDSELFLVCGGVTYNLILKPASIPAQTIELAPPEDMPSELKGKDTEEILGILVGFAIENSFPKSFQSQDINKPYEMDRNGGKLHIVYRKLWTGSGYKVKEYHIYSSSEMSLIPSELVAFPEADKPLAASLTSERFQGWTRGFVVEADKK